MKIIALGDTHGRTNWKSITAKDDFDKVIFIGDYFDSHEGVSARDQINNFKDLMAFKRSNPHKVVLLFGNHDAHYLKTFEQKYGRYEKHHGREIQSLIHDALDMALFKMCHVEENIVFTHAGVTKTWMKDTFLNVPDYDPQFLESCINRKFLENPNAFKFIVKRMTYDPTGDNSWQSPIWVRPDSLRWDRLDKYIQVVGHTPQHKLNASGDIIFIDTLGTSSEYLQIVDGIFSAMESPKNKRKIKWKSANP